MITLLILKMRMNVVTDEFDEYWWESLVLGMNKQIVEDTIERLSEVSYVDSLLTTGLIMNQLKLNGWNKNELSFGI